MSLIETLTGVKTSVRTNRVCSTVGVTTQEVAPHAPSRLSLLVVNLSANDIYVGFDRDVSTSKGIRLTPNGGVFSLQYDVDFDAVGYALYGLASGAASAVYVIEILGV